MKKIVFLFLMLSAIVCAIGPDAIRQRPNERWWSEDVSRNPLYNWVQEADKLIEAGMGIGTGQVFYVDSGVTTAGNGNSWDTAVATIDAAIGKCVASRGDVILVAQGHAETISAAASNPTLDIAGVTIIGMGSGSLIPTITFTHVDATFSVTAANCRIGNLRFVSNLDNVKVLLTLAATADGAIVTQCQFRDSAANKDYLVGISLATACDEVTLAGNDFRTTAAAGGNNAILTAAVVDLKVVGNTAFGKFATGALLGNAALVRGVITDNVLVNSEAAIAIALNTSSTGVLARNMLGGTTSIAAALTGDNAMWCFENYVSGAAAVSGVINPAGDAD